MHFPSKYLDILIKYNLEKFKRLIQYLNIKDGLIAFQCLVKDNDIIPFDPTYRIDGSLVYHFIENQNSSNAVEMLIRKSITGSMGNDEEISKKETPYFKNPCVEIPILLKKGTITKIVGLEEIKNMEDVIHVYEKYNIGKTFTKEADFSQISFRILLSAKDDKKLQEDIDKIYSVLKVYDENGNNMVSENLYRIV